MFSIILIITLLVSMMLANAEFIISHEPKTESFLSSVPSEAVKHPSEDIGDIRFRCPRSIAQIADSCLTSEHSCLKGNCGLISQQNGGLVSCSCDAVCYLFNDCCHDVEMCTRLEKPTNAFAFAGSQEAVTFYLQDLDICDEENQVEISSVYFTDSELTALTVQDLISGFHGDSFIYHNPGPVKERLCGKVFRWTFCRPESSVCKEVYVSNMTSLCEATQTRVVTNPTTVSTTQSLSTGEAYRNNNSEKSSTNLSANFTISRNKIPFLSREIFIMNEELTSEPRPRNSTSVDEDDKVEKNESPDTDSRKPFVNTSSTTAYPTEHSCPSSIEVIGSDVVRETSGRNHLLYVTHANTSFWHVFRTQSASQLSWRKMQCVRVRRNPQQGKAREMWSCHLTQCKTGMFFYQQRCLKPEKLTVTFHLSSEIVDSYLEQMIQASRNAVLNYRGMIVRVPNNANITENINNTKYVEQYLILDIKSNDVERTMPISRTLYDELASVILLRQTYSVSVEICVHFKEDSNWSESALQRCDLLTSDGITSDVEDYTIEMSKNNATTETQRTDNSYSQDHTLQNLMIQVTDSPLSTNGTEIQNKTKESTSPQDISNTDSCHVPPCSDNEQSQLQENTAYQNVTLSNAGLILEISAVLTQLSMSLFVFNVN